MNPLLYMAAKALLRSKLSLVLLLLAVAAGVGFQIPNAANLNGYTRELLRHGVLRDTGHVLVKPARGEETIPRAAAALDAVEALPFARGATARLIHAGLLYNREARQPCRVVGIDPARERRVGRLCRHVGRGRCPSDDVASAAGDEALVGDRLAERLNLKVGDQVRLVVPVQDLDEVTLARRRLRVVGIMDGGGFRSGYDLFVPRAWLAGLLDWGDEASLIAVYVDDHKAADGYAPRVAAAVLASAPAEDRPRIEAVSWREADSFVTSAVEGNRKIFVISMTMVIFAVGIPVLALLYIHVLQDRRQIAGLAALGFSRRDLFVIYLAKALLLGVAGALTGIGVGLGVCAVFGQRPIFEYHGFVVQPVLSWEVVAIPAGILLGVTLLAGLAPAIKAARANPALELQES